MIQRLHVKNYRCLEDFTLDLTDKPTALLIGKNGSGKSTVIDALRIFKNIYEEPNSVRNIIGVNDFTRRRTDLPLRLELDALIGGKTFRYAVAFDWSPDAFEARISAESLTQDGESIFDREQAHVAVAGSGSFDINERVFALRVINEKTPKGSLYLFKYFLSRMMLLSPIPNEILGFSERPESGIDSRATNFASVLRQFLVKFPKVYTEFEKAIKNVIPDFSSIENVDRGKEGGTQLVVTFEPPGSGRSFSHDFDELSDGEKCFFLSAYVLAESNVHPPVVCVWDEPDNHLSISEIGHFIIDMRRMANRGGQFIATSHHPEAIQRFSDENTFVLTRNSHLEPTHIRQLSDIGYTGSLVDALARGEIIEWV